MNPSKVFPLDGRPEPKSAPKSATTPAAPPPLATRLVTGPHP